MPESLHLLLVGRLGHLEDQRRLTKPEVLRGNVPVQEDVDTWRKETDSGSNEAPGPFRENVLKNPDDAVKSNRAPPRGRRPQNATSKFTDA